MAKAWDYFDADEFAERVLARSPAGGHLTLRWAQHQVRALGKVPPLTELFVHMDNINDFSFLQPHMKTLVRLELRSNKSMAPVPLPFLPALQALTFSYPGITGLGFLDDLPRLNKLWLPECDMVTDYSPLRHQTALTILWMLGCSNLTNFSMLPPLGRLRTLGVNDSQLNDGLEKICRAAPGLTGLMVNRCDWVTKLHSLTTLPLRELGLDGCPNVTDFEPISSLAELRTLSLANTRIEDLRPLRNLSNLHRLWLTNCHYLTDLSQLASLPSLKVLDLTGAAPGLDLSPLVANRKLTVMIKAGQHVKGAMALGRRLKIAA